MIPATNLVATTISIQPSTLAPPATQHFVQEAFLIGSAMRKALSICLSGPVVGCVQRTISQVVVIQRFTVIL
jgi:hypothetical protein